MPPKHGADTRTPAAMNKKKSHSAESKETAENPNNC
jgi:hypothetical protein